MKGFSIIELVIVLLITAIIAVIAIPFWLTTVINLNVQADQLEADILYTQSLSISTGQPHHIKFLTAAGVVPAQYEVRNMSTNKLIKLITLNGTSFSTFFFMPTTLFAFDANGVPNLADPPFSVNTLVSLQIAHGQLGYTVGFVELTGQGKQVTVTVAPTTGFTGIVYGSWRCLTTSQTGCTWE